MIIAVNYFLEAKLHVIEFTQRVVFFLLRAQHT